MNNSTNALTVQYDFRLRKPTDIGCDCPAGYLFEPPAEIRVDSLRKGVWHDLPAAAFRLDSAARRIEIVLEPQMAVRITTLGSYMGDSTAALQNVNVVALKLDGSSGTESLSGTVLLRAFRKMSDAVYVLRYP
jgi:hypothetical protein